MTSYTHFSTGEKPINNFALPSVESGMWWLETVQDFVLKLGMKLHFFTISVLICTLISENRGLEKSRSVSNLSGPAHLDLFSVCHLDFYQVYGKNLAFFLGGDLEKNPGLQDLKFF